MLNPDTWLSNIFGYPVFKVTLSDDPYIPAWLGDLAARIQAVSANSRVFCYAKVPARKVEHLQALNRAGFNVVDVNLTLERKPAIIADSTGNSAMKIEEINPRDHAAVLNIAESSFLYSRFHLDPCIDNQVANTVKRQWIQSYIDGKRGEHLLVPILQGVPVGFLAILNSSANGQRTGVIDLMAVARSHQGMGAGKQLISSWINDSVGRYEKLLVGTQAANFPSVRLYEECGFRYAQAAYVLHGHFGNGESRQ